MYRFCCILLLCISFAHCQDESLQTKTDVMERVKHHYADNNGVKIHYVSLGTGPLMVMIHGFPDFWYTWRDQMEELSENYRVVAVDLRGYNKSDAPEGVENYTMPHLVSDIVAVIQNEGQEKAIVVAHDWGGAIAWGLAMSQPQMVEKLIICNSPHPRGIYRELATNPEQSKNSQYARNFQQEGAYKLLTPEKLTAWVTDPVAKEKYIAAFKISNFEAMLNYYKANYPREPYLEDTSPIIKVKCSVLLIHGLDDWALLPGALNNTWEWLEKDVTIVTVPGSGHFVQQDASEVVTRSIKMWLNQ